MEGNQIHLSRKRVVLLVSLVALSLFSSGSSVLRARRSLSNFPLTEPENVTSVTEEDLSSTEDKQQNPPTAASLNPNRLPYPEEHLPLLPWEIQSAVDRECSPPKGTPSRCCLGTLSKGRKIKFSPDKCVLGLEDYYAAESRALEYLRSNPIVYGESSETLGCDGCQIASHLIRHNLTLSLQGDSISRQSFLGLECELRRRGFNVTLRGKYFQPHPPAQPGRWRYGLSDTTQLTVEWPGDPSGNQGVIRFFGMYRPLENMKEVKLILAQSDIVVFDHGHHFKAFHPHEMRMFNESITGMLQAAKDVWKGNPSKILAWRESSATHWGNSTGGDYDAERRQQFCGPVKNNRNGVRLPVVKKAAESVGMALVEDLTTRPKRRKHELAFFEYRDFTLDMHYLHTSGGDDCTHMCSTPDIWLPIWRNLRNSMDRTYI